MAELDEFLPVPYVQNQISRPPNYETLNIIEKIVYVRSISTSSRQFMKQVYGITCSSLVSFLLVLILLGPLSITQLYLSLTNLKKCPAEWIIPYWLLSSAILNILIILLKFIHNITVITKHKTPERLLKNSFGFKTVCVLVGSLTTLCFVLGNIWVYPIYKRVDYNADKDPYQYCDKVLYLFSFWYLNTVFITLTIVIVLVPCVLFIVSLLLIKKK